MKIIWEIWDIIRDFGTSTGIAQLFQGDGWKQLIMIAIAVLLLYLAVFKEAEPYLLIPIGFGMLLVNLPGSNIYIKQIENAETIYTLSSFADYVGISVDKAAILFQHLGLEIDSSYTLEHIAGLMVKNGTWVEGYEVFFTGTNITELEQTYILKLFTTYEYL